MSVRDRRWPIDDLIVCILAKRKWTEDVELTDDEIAQDCNVHPRAVARWREMGLTAANADLAACALGLHPYYVWPTMVDTDLVDSENAYRAKLASNRRMDAARRDRNNAETSVPA